MQHRNFEKYDSDKNGSDLIILKYIDLELKEYMFKVEANKTDDILNNVDKWIMICEENKRIAHKDLDKEIYDIKIQAYIQRARLPREVSGPGVPSIKTEGYHEYKRTVQVWPTHPVFQFM